MSNKILETEFCDMKFKNPFILASAPPARNAEMIKRAFDEGWAGAVTKTIAKEPTKDPSPRIVAVKKGKKNIGSLNIELISPKTPEEWTKEIESIKKDFPENIIWASIMASANLEEWQELAKTMEDAGADALELNVSCPHGMPEKSMGALIGQDANLTKEITNAVKESVEIPVITKLTPNVTDINLIAKAAAEGNADGLAAINTVQALSGIDLETFNPLPNVDGTSVFGGYGGKAVKPIALRCISQIQVGLPVSAMGGISTWQDAAEFMLVGATTVQVCTGVMFEGYSIVKNMISGISKYLEEKNLSSVGELIGLAQPKIGNFSDLNLETRSIPKVTEEECNACGICVTSCTDSGFQAIEMVDEVAHILKDKCDGCGLCIAVCPNDAIKA